MKNLLLTNSSERGLGMPVALLLSMVMIAIGAIYSSLTQTSNEILKSREHSKDLFYVAEGAVHNILSNMAIASHLWLAQTKIDSTPLDYTAYNPISYSSDNGIPTCSGIACQRHLYPQSGGLIKNAGPISSSGADVNSNLKINQQIYQQTPPESDITINDTNAWSQVERLDEGYLGNNSFGADLSNNPDGSSGANSVRFRITGTAIKDLKGRTGKSTIIVIVEIPPA
jgi:hypothetical protein